MHEDKNGLKLSISLQMPTEKEYKPSIEERVDDALERLMYDGCQTSYNFLRRLNSCLVKCWKSGHKSDQIHRLLGLVTPAMVKYGLEDVKGLELIEPFVTNPDYKEDNDEDSPEVG